MSRQIDLVMIAPHLPDDSHILIQYMPRKCPAVKSPLRRRSLLSILPCDCHIRWITDNRRNLYLKSNISFSNASVNLPAPDNLQKFQENNQKFLIPVLSGPGLFALPFIPLSPVC